MPNLSFIYWLPVVCILIFSIDAFAQHHYLDVNVRASTSVTVDPKDSEFRNLRKAQSLIRPSIELSAEVVFFPRPVFGVGVFYSANQQPGEHEIFSDFMASDRESFYHYGFSSYGISAHVTTSRNKGFQVYGVVRGGRYTLEYDYVDLQESGTNSGNGFTAGVGMKVKLAKQISFNILECNYMWLPEGMSVSGVNKGRWVNIQSGLTVKFVRKR